MSKSERPGEHNIPTSFVIAGRSPEGVSGTTAGATQGAGTSSSDTCPTPAPLPVRNPNPFIPLEQVTEPVI